MLHHRISRMAITIGMPVLIAVLALGTIQPSVSALDPTIISDSTFVSADQGFYGEKIDQLFLKIGSPFANYSESISTQPYSAGDIFWTGSQGIDFGINPKVLIAIYAFENRLNHLPEARLEPVIQSITGHLMNDFRAYQAGERKVTLSNGTNVNVGQSNPASFALARYFAPSMSSEFDLQLALSRWQSEYFKLFGVFPQEEILAAQSSPDVAPFLRLPFDQPANSFLMINSFFDHDNPGTTDDIILRFDGASLSGANFSPCTLGVSCYGGHNGLDYSTGAGRPVLAAANGKVIYYYYNTDSSAGTVDSGLMIDHGNGYITAYWHMDPILVHMNDTITKGQVVGMSGNIGRSSGAHLHFAVKTIANKWIDPYGWWNTVSTAADPWGDSRWLFGNGLISNDREDSMQFFYRSYWTHDTAGYGNGSTYTSNVTSAAATTNWAIWATYIQTAGNYEVFAYFPQKSDSTTSARYRVFYSGGSQIVPISQQNSGDTWVSLGTFPFNHGAAAVILDDFTTPSETNKKIYFDAIKWQPFTDSPPTDIQISSASVAENVATGTVVGSLTAVDPDAGDSTTFSLVSGPGSTGNNAFSIQASQLKTAAVLDFELKNSYSIRVRATDIAGKTFEKILTITVTNANDPPTGISLSGTTIPENSPAATTIGSLSATDPDSGETFTYSLLSGIGSDNNASFTISGNTLKSIAIFDYETQKNLSIRVRATDHGGLSFEKSFSIAVSDMNESPQNISLSNASIPEAQPDGSLVGLLSAVDPDSSNTFTYSIVTGSGSNDNSLFSISGNKLSTAAVLDYETKPTYNLRVRTTDQGGLSFEKAFTISITPVNEFAPFDVSIDITSIAENQPADTLVGTFSSSDADLSDSFTYSLVIGPGSEQNGFFYINADRLYTRQPFDYESENLLSIRIRTTDSGGLTFEKAVVLSVTDVNETPTDLLLDSQAVLEAQPSETNVGTFVTSDPDAGDTTTFTLVNGSGSTDNSSFIIQGNLLRTAKELDYETRTTLSIRVRATDKGGLYVEKSLTLQILPVNEFPPTAINLSSASIPENSETGSVVGTLTTLDADRGDSHTFELVDGIGGEDIACFEISGNQLLSNCLLNYEQKAIRSILVRVTDSGGLSYEHAFTIAINDRQELLFPLVIQ